MNQIIKQIRQELKENSNPADKTSAERFFKEPIKLYGMKTPVAVKIGKNYLQKIREAKLNKEAVFELCEELWRSGYQEEIAIACLWSHAQSPDYKPADFKVFSHWVEDYVSNWAACDTLCNHTIGDLVTMYPQLAAKLIAWTKSKNRWVKRAAAVTLIIPAREGKFLDKVFQIANALLTDTDDMVQKGYGWMLKAASDKHERAVWQYVMDNKDVMPRTALRYAIEKMQPELKKQAMVKPARR